MARGGVTYLDVAKAAEKLKNKGIVPTIDRVREILGTGSKTTLAHNLKRWKSITPAETEYQTIPAELVQSVKNLHEQLTAHAQQKIEELKQRSQQEIAQLLQQNQQERENAGTLKRNILNLEANNNKLNKEIEALKKALANSEQINMDVTAEKNELATRLQEKSEQIIILKDQLKSVENNGEHYREMLKQQRDEEKTQFMRQIELLQQENNSYRIKVAERNKQIEKFKQDHFELNSKIKYIEKQYTSKVAENELLSNQLLTATTRQEELLKNFINSKNLTEQSKKKRAVATRIN